MSVIPHGRCQLGALVIVLSFMEAAAEEKPATTTPVPSPPAKHLSTEVTQAVSASLPKYAPPTPAPALGFAPFAAPPVDEPLSDVLYLPSVKVTGNKLPPLTSYDFLTPKGRLESALKTHPGLGLGPLAALNNGIAVEMQKEEIEAGRRSALKDQVLSVAVGGDAKSREEINLMRAATDQPNNDWRR